jgi:hypothetical protein
MRNAYKIMVGKSEGKRPLGFPGRTLENNLKMNLQEVWFEDLEWIHQAKDRDQWWTLEHGRASLSTIIYWNFFLTR